MSLLETALANLVTPPLLFFALGALAALLRSDLDIPAPIGKALSLYLMVAIGYKGGLMLAEGGAGGLVPLATAAVAVSFLLPVVAFALLRASTKLATVDAAAVSAHYGSVSIVTFVTAAAFLETQDTLYAGGLVAVLALMESPAIVTGLLLARRGGASGGSTGHALSEALRSGSILLLVGSLVIGAIAGVRGITTLSPVLITPFQGVLAFFLLDMGLLAARRLKAFKLAGAGLWAFGLYMPLLGATAGLLLSWLLGLDVGDATLFMVLCASASYIAVPAAMRQALPQADQSIYVPLTLGVTFPFNILVGIPLYSAVAQWALG
jgi:uncharacterized protein